MGTTTSGQSARKGAVRRQKPWRHLLVTVTLPYLLAGCQVDGIMPRQRRPNPWADARIEPTRPAEGGAEGRAEGRAEGGAEGGAEGRAEGRAEGEAGDEVEPQVSLSAATSRVTPASYVQDASSSLELEPLAPPEPEASRPITLEQLEAIALANNPTIVLAQSQIAKERGNWVQVGLWPNPVLGYTRSDPDTSSQSHTNEAFVQQTFVTAGKLRLARQQEAYGIEDARQALEAQRHRVVNDVRTRFYQALGAQHTVAVGHEMVTLAAAGLDVARQSEQAREASRVEVVQAQMQWQRMRLAVRQAERQADVAWQQLMDMVGTPEAPRAPLAGRLDEDLPDLDRQQQWQRLTRESPLLRQLDAQVGVARKALELAVAQRVPDVTSQILIERDSTQNSTSVQSLLAASLPLFNRNQGSIYTARYELQRAQTERQRTLLALRDALEAAFGRYAAARDQVRTLRQELLPAARENLELTIQGQAAGELSLGDVLAARQVVFETTVEYANALAELRVAAVEVQGMQLSGGLNPAEIGTAIQSSDGGGSQRRAVQQLLERQQQQGNFKRFAPGTTGD